MTPCSRSKTLRWSLIRLRPHPTNPLTPPMGLLVYPAVLTLLFLVFESLCRHRVAIAPLSAAHLARCVNTSADIIRKPQVSGTSRPISTFFAAPAVKTALGQKPASTATCETGASLPRPRLLSPTLSLPRSEPVRQFLPPRYHPPRCCLPR